MYTNSFEKAFGDFIDRAEYDQAENALFSMARTSFLAGWKAAGGSTPTAHGVFQLRRKGSSDFSANDVDTSE